MTRRDTTWWWTNQVAWCALSLSNPETSRYADIFKPVHARRRYAQQTLVHILKHHHGFTEVFSMCWGHGSYITMHQSFCSAVNRLDRQASGLMVIPLTLNLARALSREFLNQLIKKVYIARCIGEFPEYVPVIVSMLIVKLILRAQQPDRLRGATVDRGSTIGYSFGPSWRQSSFFFGPCFSE
jgi:23S rRNA-/tRNA-specific pseudouridylate synthase